MYECVWGVEGGASWWVLTGPFAITVLAFLHHKVCLLRFSGVSAEQITINTINSKTTTGVSNGVGNPNMFGTPSSRSFLLGVRVVQTGSLVLFDLYVCIIVLLFLYREGSLIYLDMGTVRPLEKFSLYAIIISYSL